VSEDISLTATLDILRAIAEGRGPKHALFALGYAGWGAGQVENEFQFNGWLHCHADPALVFGTDPHAKWSRALARLGIGPSGLVADAGRA
jgi:putative transcriptional regulator